ncbi:MAG: peptide chain release factor N(5)-glutamine methyltransferase [Deltaproteobacteria bacterium]|nr:peptide chain release factor N(5)-glutamine methyltransferase [Candidatus Anaeroferrophillus wilburensis]MBN2888644.1 peptide chain release factor N(5)-glutamine methyltransferase [Deltaproteobacteria bacterium]
MSDLWTVISLLGWAAPYLEKHGVATPRLDAELLLARVLACRRLDLYLHHDRPLSADELAAFKKLLLRRRQREPIAHILGEREFWSLPFMVSPDVLVPRPETEHLVEAAAEILTDYYPDGGSVVDFGTGSGAIVLALANQFKEKQWYSWLGIDLSSKAVAVAKENARRLDLPQVRFAVADLRQIKPAAGETWDVVLANPPYIPTADLSSLSPEVCREPRAALDGGQDGLDYYRALSRRAAELLGGCGFMIVEVGDRQAAAVLALLAEQHPAALYTKRDLRGIERVVVGRWTP